MANKTIGHIPYSLSLRKANPMDEESAKKIYATLQSRETIDLALMAEHMAEHNTPFSAGTILGVLRDLVSCTVEQLRQGYAVKLDGLCTLHLSCKSKGEDTVQEFNPQADIKKIRIGVLVDKTAQAAVNTDIDYEYAMTREEQAAAKKAAKAALPQEEATGDGGDDPEPDPNVDE